MANASEVKFTSLEEAVTWAQTLAGAQHFASFLKDFSSPEASLALHILTLASARTAATMDVPTLTSLLQSMRVTLEEDSANKAVASKAITADTDSSGPPLPPFKLSSLISHSKSVRRIDLEKLERAENARDYFLAQGYQDSYFDFSTLLPYFAYFNELSDKWLLQKVMTCNAWSEPRARGKLAEHEQHCLKVAQFALARPEATARNFYTTAQYFSNKPEAILLLPSCPVEAREEYLRFAGARPRSPLLLQQYRDDRMVSSVMNLHLASSDPEPMERQEAFNNLLATPMELFSFDNKRLIVLRLRTFPGTEEDKYTLLFNLWQTALRYCTVTEQDMLKRDFNDKGLSVRHYTEKARVKRLKGRSW